MLDHRLSAAGRPCVPAGSGLIPFPTLRTNIPEQVIRGREIGQIDETSTEFQRADCILKPSQLHSLPFSSCLPSGRRRSAGRCQEIMISSGAINRIQARLPGRCRHSVPARPSWLHLAKVGGTLGARRRALVSRRPPLRRTGIRCVAITDDLDYLFGVPIFLMTLVNKLPPPGFASTLRRSHSCRLVRCWLDRYLDTHYTGRRRRPGYRYSTKFTFLK